MSFPIAPLPVMYQSPAPTVSNRGRLVNTGDGFPAGSLSFSLGIKVVVVCCQPAGSPQAANVTLNGVAMIQAAQTGVVNGRSASVWYLETTASGTLPIGGTGGSGRSALDVYEIRNYKSATPYYTGTLVNAGNTSSLAITVPTPTNGIVLGSGLHGFTNPTISADIGPAPTVTTAAYESATGHYSWTQTPTWRGPTTYNVVGSLVSGINLAVAAWK
jgi:hypothetical protein